MKYWIKPTVTFLAFFIIFQSNSFAGTKILPLPKPLATKETKSKVEKKKQIYPQKKPILEKKLWTYSPQTDRIIQISGHMLRQSVNGSDMSYKDMMETRSISEIYNLTLEESIFIDNRDHWVIYMEAKVKGLSYPKRRAWIDKEYFLPIKEELYAKSGKLLKTTSMSNIKKTQGRWFPFHYKFKDELKRNSRGTEWIINEIEFDNEISESRFSKALLRK